MALLSGTFFQVARVGSPSMTHLMAGSKSSGMRGHSVALTFAKTRLYYNPFREDISARNWTHVNALKSIHCLQPLTNNAFVITVRIGLSKILITCLYIIYTTSDLSSFAYVPDYEGTEFPASYWNSRLQRVALASSSSASPRSWRGCGINSRRCWILARF